LARNADIEERSVDAMRKRSSEVLNEAYSLGIKYYDCARSYGKAEEFFSQWAKDKNLSPTEIVTGSKWG